MNSQKIFIILFSIYMFKNIKSISNRCLELQASNSFGGATEGNCFKVSLTNLNELIIYTGETINGLEFIYKDNSNISFIQNKNLRNSLNLKNAIITEVDIWVGSGIDGLRFQIYNFSTNSYQNSPEMGKNNSCHFKLNALFLNAQFYRLDSISGCTVSNNNGSRGTSNQKRVT